MLNPPPESIDLLALCQRLRRHDPTLDRVEGYLEGKTLLRDRLVALLDCSELEAERLVDTLEARGFLRFRGSERKGTTPGYWELTERPAS
jgi:hypothetical protein